MNRALEKILDQLTTKRLEILHEAIRLGHEQFITTAAKNVIVIGTRTATGSLVYIASRTKDTKVRTILAQQIATASPLRQEYKHQLMEITENTGALALLYAAFDDASTTQPTWQGRAETFDERSAEDTHWLAQVLDI